MSTPSWQKIYRHPEFKSLDDAAKKVAFDDWESDFTKDLLELGAEAEDLNDFKSTSLAYRYQINNPDDPELKDQKRVDAFVQEQFQAEGERLLKAGPVWDEMFKGGTNEAVRLTEDGALVVNPLLQKDPVLYRQVIMDADASASAKAEALRHLPAWKRIAENRVANDYLKLSSQAELPKPTSDKVEQDTWKKIKLKRDAEGNVTGVSDPRWDRVENAQPNYLSLGAGTSIPTNAVRKIEGLREIPGLNEWARRAEDIGVDPDQVLERVKTRYLWGSAEDEGNLMRRDQVNGDIVLNPVPQTRSGTRGAHMLYGPKGDALWEREAKRLKLTAEEKKNFTEVRNQYLDGFADMAYEELMATSFDDTGVVNTVLTPLTRRDEAIGLKADFKAYAIANKDKPKREIVEGWLEKYEDLPQLSKWSDNLSNSLLATTAKFESGAVKLLALAGDAAILPFTLSYDVVDAVGGGERPTMSLPLLRMAAERYAPIERRVSMAEGVASVPFVSDVGNEALWIGTTLWLGNAARLAARGASTKVARGLIDDPVGAVAENLLKRNEGVARIMPELRVVAPTNQAVRDGRAWATEVVTKNLKVAAEDLVRIEADLIKAIGQNKMTATVYGTASARSGTAMYADAYTSYTQQYLDEEMSLEEAKSRAAGTAVIPALFAAAITPTVMKMVPGGVERLYGMNQRAGSEMTLGQLRQLVGEKNLLQVFKQASWKQLGQVLKPVFIQSGREGLEEGIDEVGQVITALMSYRPDMTFSEGVKQASHAVYLGLMMGGGSTAISSARDKSPIRRATPQQFAAYKEMLQAKLDAGPVAAEGVVLGTDGQPIAASTPASTPAGFDAGTPAPALTPEEQADLDILLKAEAQNDPSIIENHYKVKITPAFGGAETFAAGLPLRLADLRARKGSLTEDEKSELVALEEHEATPDSKKIEAFYEDQGWLADSMSMAEKAAQLAKANAEAKAKAAAKKPAAKKPASTPAAVDPAVDPLVAAAVENLEQNEASQSAEAVKKAAAIAAAAKSQAAAQAAAQGASKDGPEEKPGGKDVGYLPEVAVTIAGRHVYKREAGVEEEEDDNYVVQQDSAGNLNVWSAADYRKAKGDPDKLAASRRTDFNPAAADMDVIYAALAKAGGVAPAKEVDEEIEEALEDQPAPVVKRSKDFASTGIYEVQIGDQSFRIFRDPENGWWYDDAKLNQGPNPSAAVIGFTKAEALENLVKNGGLGAPGSVPAAKKPAAKTPAKKPAAPAKKELPPEFQEQPADGPETDAVVNKRNELRVRFEQLRETNPDQAEMFTDAYSNARDTIKEQGFEEGSLRFWEVAQASLDFYANEAGVNFDAAPVATPEAVAKTPAKKVSAKQAKKDAVEKKKAEVRFRSMENARQFGWLPPRTSSLAKEIGLNNRDASALRASIMEELEADPDVDVGALTAAPVDTDQAEQEARLTKQRRDRAMGGKSAVDVANKRAGKTLQRAGVLRFTRTPAVTKAQNKLKGLVKSLADRVERSSLAKGATDEQKDVVRGLVQAQMLRDSNRSLFAQEALSQPESEQDGWIISQLKQGVEDGPTKSDHELLAAAFENGDRSVEKMLAEIKTDWANLVVTDEALTVWVSNEFINLNKAEKSREEVYGTSSSLDQSLGEDGDTSVGDITAAEDQIAPDEMAAALERNESPVTPAEEAAIRQLAKEFRLPESGDIESLIEDITDKFYTEEGEEKNAFTLALFKQPGATEREKRAALVRKLAPVVKQAVATGRLQTKASAKGTTQSEAENRARLAELGIVAGDPASIITGLKAIAADVATHGAHNVALAKLYLRDEAGILQHLGPLTVGDEATQYDPNNGGINISPLNTNSWGLANGILEEVGHLIDHKVRPLTESDRAELRAQILKAREKLPQFVTFIESNLDSRYDMTELLKDLLYSLGYTWKVDSEGVDHLYDLLNGNPADEWQAVMEFSARFKGDPFTNRVLGSNKDFSNGVYAWHAKHNFNMLPDRTSPKGKLLQASLQADGEDQDILNAKAQELEELDDSDLEAELQEELAALYTRPSRRVFLPTGEVQYERNGKVYQLANRAEYDELRERLDREDAEANAPFASNAEAAAWLEANPLKLGTRIASEDLAEFSSIAFSKVYTAVEVLADSPAVKNSPLHGLDEPEIGRPYIIDALAGATGNRVLGAMRRYLPQEELNVLPWASVESAESQLDARREMDDLYRQLVEFAPDEVSALMREALAAEQKNEKLLDLIDDVEIPKLFTRNAGPQPLTPPISMFRSRQALADMKGVFKPLGIAQDGTVPWVNLKAKIEKGFKKAEADMVLAAIEPLVANGRINPDEAVEAMDALARASVQVVKLNANAAGIRDRTELEQEEARLAHLMDTEYPGWNQYVTDEDGSYFEPAQLPDDALSRFSEEFADDYAAWLAADLAADPDFGDGRPESATARFAGPNGVGGVNPKPLDQMPGAQDVTVEEPVPLSKGAVILSSGITENGVPYYIPDTSKLDVPRIKFSEGTHFPTRKNVIGFARMYTEKWLGKLGTFIFEVQSDWASRAKDQERARAEIPAMPITEEDGQFRLHRPQIGPDRIYPTREAAEQQRAVDLREVLRGTGVMETTPLLSIHETLSLKAAIADARAKGQTWVAITDAETAMMTEGHDARLKPKHDPETLGKWMARDVPNKNTLSNSGQLYFDTREEALEVMNKFQDRVNPQYALEVHQINKADITPPRPTQEPGMRAAYDPDPIYNVVARGTKEVVFSSRYQREADERAEVHGNAIVTTSRGRLHEIMYRLTGDKGKPVNFGVHQNAATARQNAGFDTESEARDFAATLPPNANPRVDENPIADDQGNWMVNWTTYPGSPVFNGKSDITAVAYDITKVSDTELSALFTRNASTPGPLADAAKVHAPLLQGRPVWGTAPQALDPRLKPTPVVVHNDRIEIDPELENDMPQAARLLAKENAYVSFRRSLAPIQIDEIRNAKDKAAFLPILNEVAVNPQAADDLFQSMDDVAVEAILRGSFNVDLDPGIMDALEEQAPLGTRNIPSATLAALDLKAQARWLLDQSRARRYASITELLYESPDTFRRLAQQWRKVHPEPDAEGQGFRSPLAILEILRADSAGERGADGPPADEEEQLSQEYASLRDLIEGGVIPTTAKFPKIYYRNLLDASNDESQPHVLRGAEHFVILPAEGVRGRVFKITQLNYKNLPVMLAMGGDSVTGYMRRMEVLNQYHNADIRFEGVVESDRGWHLVTSHPVMADSSPLPDKNELEAKGHQWLTNVGYLAVDPEERNQTDRFALDYYHPETGVVLSDVGLGNLQVTRRKDGSLRFRLRDVMADRYQLSTIQRVVEGLADQTQDSAEVLVDLRGDAPLYTRNSEQTAHPIPGTAMAFIKDAEGNVVNYTDSYDPALPVLPPNTADQLEHARIEAGYNATRLGTRLASERSAEVPVDLIPLQTRNAGDRKMSNMPLLSDGLPLPRPKGDVGLWGWNLWAGKDTLAAQGGYDQSGLFRYGRLPVRVKQLDFKRQAEVRAAQSLGENFSAETTRFLPKAEAAGMSPEAAEQMVNDALGSTRNWTDTEVAKKLDDARKVANKQAQGLFLSSYPGVAALRAAGDPVGADALHEQLVQDLRDSISQNRADMEASLQADRDLRYRQTKNRQTEAHRQILSIDPEFHERLVSFRRDITAQGREIVRYTIAAAQALKGTVSDAAYQAAMNSALDMKATFDRERGLWLHRTYRLHQDPKWYERIQKNHPDLAPVIAQAEAFVRDQIIEDTTKRLRRENMIARQADPTVKILKEADAQAQATTMVNTYPEMVKAGINELLDYGRTGQDQFSGGSHTSTSVPSILRKRGDIPDPIRALWGEVKNPQVNGAQALIAATQRVANKKFLEDLVGMGSYDPNQPDKPYFLIPKKLVGVLPNTAMWEPVISENDRNEAAPLAGLYGPPAVHDAMRELFDPGQRGVILGMLGKATGFAMSTKTIQSPTSHIRNGLSNGLITVALGNALNPAKLKYIRETFSLISADVRNTGSVETRKLLAELTAMGVIHDNNLVGLLREMHGDLADTLDIGELNALVSRGIERRLQQLRNLPGNYMKLAGELYQAGDDVFKIFNYFGEMHSLNWIYEKDLQAAANDPAALAALQDKIKKEAAYNVTQMMPTYSHVPELVRMVRNSPVGIVAAPFVNWSAEIIRTSFNINRQAWSDIRSDNPRRQARGVTRMASFALAMGSVKLATNGILLLAKAVLAGLAGDDDDDLRKKLPDWVKDSARALADQPTPEQERAFRETSLPPWDRNGSLLFMGKDKDGNWRYQNISYTDPYDYWKRIARSAWLAASDEGLSGTERAVDGVLAAAKESVIPFAGEQLLAGAVWDALTLDAPGQSESAPLVRTERVGPVPLPQTDEFRDFAYGVVTGTANNYSGNLVNGMLNVVENAVTPGWATSAQAMAKGFGGVIEGGKVYDPWDQFVNFAFGVRVNKVNPMESAAFRLRDMRKAYDGAAQDVLNKTLADRGTAGGGNLDGAFQATMERQKEALGEVRKTVQHLQTLKVDDRVIATQLKEAGFNDAAIRMIGQNRYAPNLPSLNTFKRTALSPGAKGQERIKRLIDMVAEANSKPVPLLDE